jgi:hypothetical protein
MWIVSLALICLILYTSHVLMAKEDMLIRKGIMSITSLSASLGVLWMGTNLTTWSIYGAMALILSGITGAIFGMFLSALLTVIVW